MGECPADMKGCTPLQLLGQKQESDMKLVSKEMGHQTDKIVEAMKAVDQCVNKIEMASDSMVRNSQEVSKMAALYKENVQRLKDGNEKFEKDDIRHKEHEDRIQGTEKDIIALKAQPTSGTVSQISKKKMAVVGGGGVLSVAVVIKLIEFLETLVKSWMK